MTSRGKTLKLTAVSALVVLALTGFSTGRGHGGGSGSHDGGGGGGCSSSSQNHDSSSGGSHRDYYDDDDYGDDDYGSSGSSGGSEATASPDDATVTLVDCASEETPYATVEVANNSTTSGLFSVTVVFRDAAGEELVSRTEDIFVTEGQSTSARIEVDDPASVPLIDECDLDDYAPAA
ncbi:hypothetical protein [Streptomyces pseudogriseolus]|uniref:hypothetical protein n=1 Tax=Streptomyces pseudogriseolus TaxID=36817 RepID=UPI001CE2DE25|nr:hypothetical protein [Streptomyces pseudogriseolus]